MRNLRLLCVTAALIAVPLMSMSAASAAGGAAFKLDDPRAPVAAGGRIEGTGMVLLPSPSLADVNKILSAPAAAPDGVLGASSASANGRDLIPGFTAGAGTRAYGTGNFPFTTKRAAETTNNGPDLGVNDPVGEYPWRATGKLWMYMPASTGKNPGWYMCTASLIHPGVLVTAAHCVHNYGHQGSGWASQVFWYPANYQANTIGSPAGAPYGVYRARTWGIPSVYYNGTDTCTTVGVVCNNDLALVVLYNNNQGSALNNMAKAGSVVGWYSYGWNGYSFVSSPYLGERTAAEITQLGYPLAIDSGQKMERTDTADVYYTSGNLKGQYWGSAQTGGSSGGPEIVNFGTYPVHNSGSSAGTSYVQAVVGVTSWGYTDTNIKVQGASWFGQNIQYPGASYSGYGGGNIGFLNQFVCVTLGYGSQC